MKKLIFSVALCGLVFFNVDAQVKKSTQKIKIEEKVSPTDPSKKVVRIEKEVDGKKQVTEEEVDLIKLPKARVYSFKGDRDFKFDTLIDGERTLKYGDGFSWEEDFPKLTDRGRRNFENLRFNIEGFADKFGRDLGEINFGESTGKDGFSNVNVYTNKPETNVLNLRFRSIEEGLVNISVVNLLGESISKQAVEDFKGEYLGQLKLPEGSKGTFFVIISQGERGVATRVKVE